MDSFDKYYYILGLKKGATNDEIKKAYRKLSLKFHPDKNYQDKFFEERFKEINEAYNFLISANQIKDDNTTIPPPNNSPNSKGFHSNKNKKNASSHFTVLLNFKIIIKIVLVLTYFSIAISFYGLLQKFMHSPIADILLKIGITSFAFFITLYSVLNIIFYIIAKDLKIIIQLVLVLIYFSIAISVHGFLLKFIPSLLADILLKIGMTSLAFFITLYTILSIICYKIVKD